MRIKKKFILPATKSGKVSLTVAVDFYEASLGLIRSVYNKESYENGLEVDPFTFFLSST